MGMLDWLFPSRKRKRESQASAPVRDVGGSTERDPKAATGGNQMTDKPTEPPKKPEPSYDKPGGLCGGVPSATLKDGDAPEGGGDFFDHYELLASKMIPVFEENAYKEVLGSGDAVRRCRICGRGEPEAKFRQEAHAIPRSLGNRWLVTRRECDECNGEYGRAHDDELSKMLLPILALLRIPGRGGPPAFKARGMVSRIGGEDKFGSLKIELSVLDKSIRTEDRSGNRFDLIFDGVNWNPSAALKSLARSAWHLLDEASQGQFEFVTRWIRGEESLFPITYHQLHFPGPGFSHVYLDVWHRKSEANVAPLVVQLAVGSTGLVLHLHSPDEEIKWWPLPPQPLTDCPPFVASGKRITVLKDGRARFSNYRITMSYSKKTDIALADESGSVLDQEGDLAVTTKASDELERLFSTPVVPVVMVTKWHGQAVSVRTLAKCTLMPTDEEVAKAVNLEELLRTTNGTVPESRRMKVVLSGNELAATFWLETEPSGRTNFGFTPDLHSVPPDVAMKTVRLMDALHSREGLQVTDDHNNVLLSVPAGTTSSNFIDEDGTSAILELLGALDLINKHCKVALRYPHGEIERRDADAALMIATLVREGIVVVQRPVGALQNATLTVTTAEEWDTLTASEADGVDLVVQVSDNPFMVLGRQVPVGKWTQSLGGVSILMADEERRSVAKQLAAGKECQIPLRHTLRIVALVAEGDEHG